MVGAPSKLWGSSINDKLKTMDDIVSNAKALVKRAVTEPMDLKYSLQQYSFYVNVQVGSERDSVNLRVTDEPWTWVGTRRPGNYRPNVSSSFRNVSNSPLSLGQSESRFTRGYFGTDTIRFGQTRLDNVYIGVANNFTEAPSLGMAVYDADKEAFPSFMEVLYQGREIKSLAHGLCFDWLERNQSVLNLGSIDTAKYNGNLVTFNATEVSDLATVELLSAAFGNKANMEEMTSVTNLSAHIEFSTSRIFLPDAALSTIVERTAAKFDNSWGSYLVDCKLRNSDLAIEFRFRGINITVQAHHFIIPAYSVLGYRYQLRRDDACALEFGAMRSYGVATNLGYDAVLGIPFARHTYLVHDYGNRQLSFAPVKFNATESNIVEIDNRGVMALSTPVTTSRPTATSTDPPDPQTRDTINKTNIGAIVGGVVGGVAGLSAIAYLGFIMIKRRRAVIVPPPPPLMHQATLQEVYGYISPDDPKELENNSRPANQLVNAYIWPEPQQQQENLRFDQPGCNDLQYQENVAPSGYSEAPGSQFFAQELSTSDQRR
ncbi:hypothetical protein Dda_2240 [Drechslerella dactyloides]|uniref:Peptidase A1 domain-containing protein n=1 Tax=Drechslerella dactyloides TaxID=74499 RepID=A0AAD6J779_DREDA|nr:hypothetical protein Dda_2240 [Drechslerella dactyloides]